MYITNPRGRRNPPRQVSVSGFASRNDRTGSEQNISKPANYTPNIPPAPKSQLQAQVQAPRMAPQTQAPRMQSQQGQTPQTAPQAVPNVQSPQAQETPMSGTGYIIVRVTTASGAIPLENALVVVTNYNPGNDIIYAKKTDISGLTEKIALPAPEKSKSLAPGNGKSYSTYNVVVSKTGYTPQTYINVPIFDGITSVQSADLIPFPENGETDRANPYNSGVFYESENPFLEQGQDNG